nr:lipopolysaccharide biosynthesis protein [Eubacterium sp.]
MVEKSRTEHSVRNTTAAMVSKIVAVLMGFATRVVFTHTLSESYVGVNGLFSDLLNVLALSELGVGTAITYALYRPIAEGDTEKQKSLMQLYCFFYRIVAGIVLVAGLAVIPFMDLLIKNQPDIDHLILIYLMYLANSVLSYLLIYKKTLIDAHQLSYLGEVYQMTAILIQDVFQIILLLTTHNFILFLVVYMICTVGNNVAISRKANQLYPYLKDKNIQPLPKEEKKGIFKNIRAMLMHKIGDVVVNNTDNLLLSSIVGIISVGCYSNYYLIIGSIHQLMSQVFRGITASVGNLGVTENPERVKRIFESSFFVGQWLYGFAAICLCELLNPFVEVSFGEQYVFPMSVVVILCANFLITGMRQATLVFRDSLGLFWFDRYKSLASALLNLMISILLARQYGTAGVFGGTIISTILTSFWVEPWILYRHSLKAKVRMYFIRYAMYISVIGIAWGLTHMICVSFHGTPWQLIGKRLIPCIFVPNVIFLICYFRTSEFGFLWQKAKGIWNQWRGGRRG